MPRVLQGRGRMLTVAVGFAGAIGSGKTTIATTLHQLLGGVFVSFGDYVRAEAQRCGLAESRETLQDLGESLIAERGWDGFCQDTLAYFGWHHGNPVVIDGVRHVEVVSALRRLVSPGRFALVFVTTAEGVRLDRLKTEGLSEDRQCARVEAHSTESQVRGPLAGIAELIVDGALPANNNARTIVRWLAQERHSD